MNSNTKYFQIGFSNCGTNALTQFFSRSGIPAIHYKKGLLARAIENNLRSGCPALAGYDEKYDAFFDMLYVEQTGSFLAFMHYRRMMQDYPNSKFILNTRSWGKWLRSTSDWVTDAERWIRYKPHFERQFGTSDIKIISKHLRKEWDEHHKDVMASVPPDRLLVFNIESDPPEKLCRFVGLPDSCAINFTKKNVSEHDTAIGRLVWVYHPKIISRVLPDFINRYIAKRLGLNQRLCYSRDQYIKKLRRLGILK